jgi:hypothetical protein
LADLNEEETIQILRRQLDSLPDATSPDEQLDSIEARLAANAELRLRHDNMVLARLTAGLSNSGENQPVDNDGDVTVPGHSWVEDNGADMVGTLHEQNLNYSQLGSGLPNVVRANQVVDALTAHETNGQLLTQEQILQNFEEALDDPVQQEQDSGITFGDFSAGNAADPDADFEKFINFPEE